MEDILMNFIKLKKKRIVARKFTDFAFMTLIFTFCLCSTVCFADGIDTLNSAKALLSKGASVAGVFIGVWGLVNLGLALKESNGSGIQNAILQIVGGAIIVAAAQILGTVDLSMATTS
jgi:hypothetical protein